MWKGQEKALRTVDCRFGGDNRATMGFGEGVNDVPLVWGADWVVMVWPRLGEGKIGVQDHHTGVKSKDRC
jgi:hypothetical protein